MAKKARAGKYSPNFTCQVFKFHQFFTTFAMDVGRCHSLFHAARLLKPCSTTMGIRPWCQSKGFRSIGVEKYWRSPRRNEVVLFFFLMEEVYFCSWENGPMVHIFLQRFLGSAGEKTIVSSATSTATLNISWWISCRWLTAMARPYFMWLHERVVFRWSRRHRLEWSCMVLKLEKKHFEVKQTC